MIINYDYEYIPITEEEYKEAENSLNIKGDDSLLDIITKCNFEREYPKSPIYRDGLKSVINNDIIGYKYYKRGDLKHCIICSEEMYFKIMEMIYNNGNI